MSYFNKKLKEREVLIKIIRPCGLAFFFPLLISFVLILGSAFFSYYLIQKGQWGIIVLILISIVGIFYLARTLFVRHFNCLMLTDQRIIRIKQKGFFDHLVSEIELIKICDISYQIKGILGTFFHFGGLYIQAINMTGEPLKIEFEKIKNPERIQELILVFKKQSEEKISKLPKEENRLLTAEEILSKTSTQEIFQLIKKFREEIGEERFSEIIKKI
ncbi:MAG: Uncharacterized protein Athens071412_701 [Parcubacteria group bacterium Athens0714_12]|nr:MAG: Uncharacterized protein Athens071412_701 [Parcubacteria group bacterium Athens0714_12]